MKIKNWLRRPLYVAISAVLTFAAVMPLLSTATALAYGEVSSRSIEMSDSSASATGVTYTVGFTPNGSSIQAIIVDFCSNDPIIGDSCTAPTGFSLGATASVSNQSSNISSYTTVGELGSNHSTLELSGTAGAVSGAVSFDINSVTNPSAVGTFYARILTFDTKTDADSYSATGTNTGLVDAGGIALSTVAQITVTSKVQEELTFCVGTTSGATSCASDTGSDVTLGDDHGVLSSSGPFVDKNTTYVVQTNATSGAAIRMKGGTLTSGSNTITATGSTPATSSAGSSQFGLCTYEASGSTISTASYTTYNGTGTGTPGTTCQTQTSQTAGTASTGGAGTAKFGFNTTATSSTYGDQLAQVSAGATATGVIAFLGNISVTQQAGIYTTTLTFIATGTY